MRAGQRTNRGSSRPRKGARRGLEGVKSTGVGLRREDQEGVQGECSKEKAYERLKKKGSL